ncbi:tRNA lysidine(34) synthetase TilS [Methylobacter sp. sgz302048]|uniref:tRNA lysidine(34) synthetase TilS n=1 Tax=Methylobacter sp. sgz302048 TaxID=3455945 RepID=UPI003F9FDED3
MLSSSVIESALDQVKPGAHLYVAYSGGVDSHVLLHLCASMPGLAGRITAVYVHHGLQAEADAWAEHCRNAAGALGVSFKALYVNAVAAPGESPEEAARNARYSALKALMDADDVLLVAQHRDDQLETVLLQLFRGSGLRGLSGMPEHMVFGRGLMLRPLLNVSRQAIRHYAEAHKLSWVEDPSNLHIDYDRNFLRNIIVPLIKQRWPACDKTVARSARHCAEAQALISVIAGDLFHAVFNEADKTLSISSLQLLNKPRQQLVIRHWFQTLGLKMPAQDFVERILSQIVAARVGSDPVLSGRGYDVRRYRDKLYCLKQSPKQALQDVSWSAGQASLRVTDDQVWLCLPSSTGILRERWLNANVVVRFRRGGEKISLPGRKGRHVLKNLFQEAGIPPWEREVMPLIYLDDKLAAVGDKWISAEFYAEKTDACIRLCRQGQE